jgi:ankyrin repeat protein
MSRSLNAQTNVRNNGGRTALHVAAANGRVEFIRWLIESGADVVAEDEERWTALHLAAENGHAVVVCLLIVLGADVIAEDKKGRAALHFAARNGHEMAVKLLLKWTYPSRMLQVSAHPSPLIVNVGEEG